MKVGQIIVTFLLCAVLSACSKLEGPINNLMGGKIRVIGHAGIGFESMLTPYPSNTVTSIRHVIEGYNADGVEVDVQITKDSVLVLLHDQTLESMTNCFGNVVTYHASELAACQYRTDFNSHILQNEKIATLEEVVRRYIGTVYDPWIYLDIKFPGETDYPDPAIRNVLMRAVNNLAIKYAATHRISATAAEADQLLYLKKLNPHIELLYDNPDFEEALTQCTENNFNGIVIANELVTKEQIARAHEKGIQVIIFGVALRKDILDAVNKHPDVIQTDNIILLQQILSE